MEKKKIVNPRLIILEFRQERQDCDFGSCTWARFYFDTTNYTLLIASDCGNYGYRWPPTPEVESFMELMSSIDAQSYLLDKISKRNEINSEGTWTACKALIEGLYKHDITAMSNELDMDDIKDACYSSNDVHVVLAELQDCLRYTHAESIVPDGCLDECIVWDFPRYAKKITEIFGLYIQPAIKQMLDDKNI